MTPDRQTEKKKLISPKNRFVNAHFLTDEEMEGVRKEIRKERVKLDNKTKTAK